MGDEDSSRPSLHTGWSERYLGGSPDREAEFHRAFAEQIRFVQDRNRRGGHEPARRAFHAKQVAGIVNARFLVAADLRPELRAGPFLPGATHPAQVRLSNASGIVRGDSEKDLRGIAIRVLPDASGVQDFLMTNARASHARDARQFMITARAMAGGRRLSAVPRMVLDLGFLEALRILMALRREASRPVASLAMETFWSRAPFAIGPHAVKFELEPLAAGATSTVGPAGPEGLRHEFVDRLRQHDVRYAFRVLHYLDDRLTPIEDGTVAWPAEGAETVAELLIPRQDLVAGDGPDGERTVDGLEFNPWNTEAIRPIGSLNRARNPVYRASAGHRAPRS